MALQRLRNNTFHRIGDRYAHYFDPDHFLGQTSLESFDIKSPKANLRENKDSSFLEIALPGFKKEEIKIELVDQSLEVSAEKNESENYKDEYLRREFHTETQRRKFLLSDKVDLSKINSTFRDGILHINLPEKKSTSTTKNTHVEVS